jgi:hypothetical protein
MGISSYCLLFDIDTYVERVIPTLHLVSQGAPWPSWCHEALPQTWAREVMERATTQRAHLKSVLAHPHLDQYLAEREILTDPPHRSAQSFQTARYLRALKPPSIEEAYRLIMGRLIEYACCTHPVKLIRGGGVSLWIDDLYEDEWFEEDDFVFILLRRLCYRMACWNDGSGGYLEGVHGWLNPEECHQLADALSTLDLYDPSPLTMSEIEGVYQADMRPYIDRLGEGGEEEIRGLTFLWLMARYASAQQRGLILFHF